MASSLMPVEEHSKGDMTLSSQAIRSLIPPTIPLRMKTEPNTIRRRRNSSSSISVRSFTSSMISRNRKAPQPTLATMPSEILDGIFQHLHQPELHALMLSNSNLSEVAAKYMYIQPRFVSTYRYAQFAYTVSHKDHYASMVRVLDLSCLQGAGPREELPPQAGWREYKYRNHEVWGVRDRMTRKTDTVSHSSGAGRESTHPAPSPFQKSFHKTRDLPIGGICHVLAACKKIKKVNLSRVQIASEYLVISNKVPPTANSGLVFLSDMPRLWPWPSSELVHITADGIVNALTVMGDLEVLKARNCLWLTTARVERLLRMSGQKLRKVDLRESGLDKEIRWAVKGGRRDVERIATEVSDNTALR